MKKLFLIIIFIYRFVETNASLENIILNKLTALKSKSITHRIDKDDCDILIAKAEKKYKIPNGLLKAIAIRESGRESGKNKRLVVWPWTINVNGKGYFFKNKNTAIEKVIAFKKQGLNIIDVGCMQINLFYHPNAFKNLEEAFSPDKNIDYAAQLLCKLKQESGSWKTAVCYYHSKYCKHYTPYCAAVMKNYEKTSKEKFDIQLISPKMINLAKFLANSDKRYEFKQVKNRNYYSDIDQKISARLHKLGRLCLAKNDSRFLLSE